MLAASAAPGVNVLIQTLEYFRKNPRATVAQLLETTRDTPEGRALQRLAAAPTDLDEVAGRSEFLEVVTHLNRQALLDLKQQLVELARDR